MSNKLSLGRAIMCYILIFCPDNFEFLRLVLLSLPLSVSHTHHDTDCCHFDYCSENEK